MRIQDIIAQHVRPGAFVVDLTRAEDELVATDWMSPDSGVHYTRAPKAHASPPAVTLVVRTLGASDSASGLPELGAAAPGIIHLVLVDRAETAVELGLLEAAAVEGWELASSHSVGKKSYPFGLLFRAPEPECQHLERLRLLNEYRYDKLLLRLRTDHVARLERRLQRAAESLAKEKKRRNAAEERAVAAERAAAAVDSGELEQERATAGRLRAQVLRLSRELEEQRKGPSEAKTNDVDHHRGGLLSRLLGR